MIKARTRTGARLSESGPFNTAAPSISGTTTVGQTLTCTTGTWGGTPSISYQYQWHRGDGELIDGATAAQYVLTLGEEGIEVYCVVKASNREGSRSAQAEAVGPIA